MHDAESYQRLLDIAAGASEEEGIRQGRADAKKGKTRPARAVFKGFEAAHGVRSLSQLPGQNATWSEYL